MNILQILKILFRLLTEIDNNTISDRAAKTCERKINVFKEFQKFGRSQMTLNIMMSGLKYQN